MVHDEIILEVSDTLAREAAEILMETMRSTTAFSQSELRQIFGDRLDCLGRNTSIRKRYDLAERHAHGHVYLSEDGLELTHCIRKGGQVPSWRLSPNNPRERNLYDHPGKARKT